MDDNLAASNGASAALMQDLAELAAPDLTENLQRRSGRGAKHSPFICFPQTQQLSQEHNELEKNRKSFPLPS